MEDTERAQAALLAFAVVTCVTFGDLMDRVLLFRVGGVPLPFFTGNFNLKLVEKQAECE